VGSAESSTGSHCRPLDLGMAALRHELMSTSGSAPTSPKTSVTSAAAAAITAAAPPSGHLFQSSVQTHPLNLAGGCSLQRPNHYNVELLRTASASGNKYFISFSILKNYCDVYFIGAVNSRSLPNIPSAMGRPVGPIGSKDHGAKVVGRRSPPAAMSGSSGGHPNAKQMLVRRSKSSAILPLRKHLIEKSLAEEQQKQAAAQAAAMAAAQAAAVSTASSMSSGISDESVKSLAIKPIEEVMEEDRPAGMDLMEVDTAEPQVVRHFAARLGTAGLSPLVIGEISNTKLTQEYLSKLLPSSTNSQPATTTNFR
jgi:hypothetical protein